MRFHLQNVENLIQETLQILLIIILCVACHLNAYKYEIKEAMEVSASSEIATASLLLPATTKTPTPSPSQEYSTINVNNNINLKSSVDYGQLTLGLKIKSIHSTQQPSTILDLAATFSQRLPTKNLITTNDSNEIDSEDYIMTKHIASRDDDDESVYSSLHATETIAAETVTETAILMDIGIEMPEATSMLPTQSQHRTHTHSHTQTQLKSQDYMHGQTRSRLRSLQHGPTYGRLNKTQDLSSLSLLSFDEDEDDDTTSTLQKRLAEQQKQQKHSGDSDNGNLNSNSGNPSSSSNNISNRSKSNSNSNSRNALTANMNGTIANFQHIGSQRIAAGGAIETASATSNSGNIKSFNIKNTAASIAASSATTASLTGGRKVESKYILPKPQKTDAPMLNYIFDTFSSANKHHHHDQRYGPHFEDVQRVGQPTNMTVQAGSSIHLNCRISLLQDKTVSWVRRNPLGENALDLLTVGLHTYTGDKRYKLEFQYPNNWRLKIANVKKDDEATYECQISTHPPRVIQINLLVNAPKVMIVDEFADPLQEKYYEIDSTLQLSCVVRNVAMATSVVFWKHGEEILNYDVTRGGVSVKTELMDDGANSTLSIAKINKADSGNYTCSISDFQNFTIVVHILNGESFAELHHGGAAPMMLRYYHHTLAINLTLLILLLCFPATCIPR